MITLLKEKPSDQNSIINGHVEWTNDATNTSRTTIINVNPEIKSMTPSKKKTDRLFSNRIVWFKNRYELRDVRNQHISISTNREQIRINVSYFYVYSHINDDKWCFHNGWSKIYYWLFNFRNSNRKLLCCFTAMNAER